MFLRIPVTFRPEADDTKHVPILTPPCTKQPRVDIPSRHGTVEATDLGANRESNTYSYSRRRVLCYFGDAIVEYVKAYVLQEDVTFKASESDGVFKSEIFCRGRSHQGHDIPMEAHLEQKPWIKSFPSKCIFCITKRCTSDRAFLGAKLLRG